MNKTFKYITVLSLALTVMVSCQQDDAVRFPEWEAGVNARVVPDADRAFLDFGNIANASLAFDIYTENTNIDEIVYTVAYTDASDATAKFPNAEITVSGSDFVDGKARVELTSAQIAEMFGLPGGVDYIGGGDNLTFTTTATLTDGRVFSAANSAPSITGGNAPSFTTQFVMIVACAFNVDEAVGNYTVVDDALGATIDVAVEVVAGPGENQVTIVDMFGHGFDVVVDINPANGAATIEEQDAWDSDNFGLGLGIAWVEGGGFFLSCAGSLDVIITHTVDAGTYGPRHYRIEKN